MRQALAQMKKPRFALNPQSDAADAKLIVLDEVSMVGEEMARDLMGFGKPILVLGDPGQLPPIKGEGAFTRDAPDVMLTEIHRQARRARSSGSPQWRGKASRSASASTKLRLEDAQGRRDAGAVAARRPGHLRHERDPAAAQQCHAPRRRIPRRRAATGPGEKIICLKNQNDIGLINGMFVTLDDIVDEGSLYFSATVTDEDGKPDPPPDATARRGGSASTRATSRTTSPSTASGTTATAREAQPDRGDLGWAITVTIAGLAVENVIVWDDGLGRRAGPPRWLYTAITRAERGLVILA